MPVPPPGPQKSGPLPRDRAHTWRAQSGRRSRQVLAPAADKNLKKIPDSVFRGHVCARKRDFTTENTERHRGGIVLERGSMFSRDRQGALEGPCRAFMCARREDSPSSSACFAHPAPGGGEAWHPARRHLACFARSCEAWHPACRHPACFAHPRTCEACHPNSMPRLSPDMRGMAPGSRASMFSRPATHLPLPPTGPTFSFPFSSAHQGEPIVQSFFAAHSRPSRPRAL